MITGVSLRRSDAVAVALRSLDGGFRPIALGVAGTYDRYGSIDGIAEDLNTELIHKWFAAQPLFLDPAHHDDFGHPPRDIELLFRYFERNLSDSTVAHPALALNGERVFAALIEKNIWDHAGTGPGDPEALFAELFADDPIPAAIYAGRVADLAGPVAATHAVHELVVSLGLSWAPMDGDEIGAQYYGEEERALVAAARARFHDVPAIQRGLDAHEDAHEDAHQDAHLEE